MTPGCAILLGLGTLLVGLAVSAETRVGVGDSRKGYERDDYRTDSRRLPRTDTRVPDAVARAQRAPLGLPPMPGSQSLDAAEVNLGRKLFFDRRLSFNGVLSCAMCHIPEQGFAQNELATPVGTQGRFVKRNAPSLYNVGYRPRLFHDGREVSLANQVWSPLLAFNEMANPAVGSVLERIAGMADYAGLFESVYGRAVSMETLGSALASYERTLVSGNSPFDRYRFGGEADAMGAVAVQGLQVFRASGCNACHVIGTDHAQFTDDQFHDTGVGYLRATQRASDRRNVLIAPGVELQVGVPPAASDLGRYEATGLSEDRWKYRTPTLRNVALTAPYMHDGSMATLSDVVGYYAGGGVPHDGQDARIRPLGLDAAQRAALVVFLEALTGSDVDQLARDARSTTIGDY